MRRCSHRALRLDRSVTAQPIRRYSAAQSRWRVRRHTRGTVRASGSLTSVRRSCAARVLSVSRFGASIAVVLALVLAVPGLLVVASWQQQNTSCATTSTATGADTSVPLPAGAAGAELTVRMGTWNVLKSNSTKRIVAGLQAVAAAGADVIAVQELQSYSPGDGGPAAPRGGVGDVGRQHRHPGGVAGQQVPAVGAGSGEGVRRGPDRARVGGRCVDRAEMDPMGPAAGRCPPVRCSSPPPITWCPASSRRAAPTGTDRDESSTRRSRSWPPASSPSSWAGTGRSRS